MKRKYLIFAGMLLATVMVSCSSEDAAGKETAPAFEFAKTSDMLNFEAALKDYMISKQQGGTNAKSNADNSRIVKEKTILLLNSLGKPELASQEVETEQLLLVAMREYSKKLTEMYNQHNTNQK